MDANQIPLPTMNHMRDFQFVMGDVMRHPRLMNLGQKAYILATIKHETANRWRPILEFHPKIGPKQPSETDSQYQIRREKVIFGYFEGKYGGREDLGNSKPGDGFTYRGRGFVQITGCANYERLGKRFDIDLVGNPDMALEWNLSLEICIVGMVEGLFTGKKLSNYLNGALDFKHARRAVNGLDKADLIARYASDFYGGLKDIERLV